MMAKCQQKDSKRQNEIDRNYRAFEAGLKTYLADHAGEFALMRKGKVIGFHPDFEQAWKTGIESHPDGLYSIQEVTDAPAFVSRFSYATDNG